MEIKLDIIEMAEKCNIDLILNYSMADEYSTDVELGALMTFRHPQLVSEYMQNLYIK